MRAYRRRLKASIDGFCQQLERRLLLHGDGVADTTASPIWSDAIEQASNARRSATLAAASTSGSGAVGAGFANIVWVNEGQASDHFSDVFGSGAALARDNV